jgi:hypothetical protein
LARIGRIIVVLLVGACTVVLVVSTLVAMSDLLWHWWEGDSFWEVWKWIDQLSLINVTVVERASFTEWAFSFLFNVFAWLSLVI